MINRAFIKKKSEELNIPFSNLFSAGVCEAIITMISQSDYGKDLWLCNGEDFNLSKYAENSNRDIQYVYCGDLDEKMMILYFRDLLKMIIKNGKEQSMTIKGEVQEVRLKLQIEIDDMYIPVHVNIGRHKNEKVSPEEETLRLTFENNKSVEYMAYPKEQVLANNLIEIISKLELINEMERYYDAYQLLTKYPINGRKVKDALNNLCKSNNIQIDRKRLDSIKSYRDYTYMKKKWKVQLRQKKKSEPQWSDLIDCLISFLSPIWDSMETNTVFIGDWMPQLKRFLD